MKQRKRKVGAERKKIQEGQGDPPAEKGGGRGIEKKGVTGQGNGAERDWEKESSGKGDHTRGGADAGRISEWVFTD